MRSARVGNGVLVGVLTIAAVAAASTAVAGFALADSYRPQTAGSSAAGWWDRQLWAGVAMFVLSALAAGMAVGELLRSSARRRAAAVLACAAAAAIAALLTLFTRDLVAWDQLALRSVTVGTDVSGYWAAAFGDDVRFVLVDASEASQTAYGAVLVVHLAAPVVGAVLLAAAGLIVFRAPRGARVPVPVAPQAASAPT